MIEKNCVCLQFRVVSVKPPLEIQQSNVIKMVICCLFCFNSTFHKLTVTDKLNHNNEKRCQANKWMMRQNAEFFTSKWLRDNNFSIS